MTAVAVLAVLAAVFGPVPALVLARRRWFMVRVTGTSMSPTYADGDHVLFRRGRFTVADCVVFVPPPPYCDADEKWLVKRVAAGAGDPLPEAFRAATGATDGVVPTGLLVVLGDNPHSLDSRHFGYLPAANVVGVAVRARAGHEPRPTA